jgi:hypothetical protein
VSNTKLPPAPKALKHTNKPKTSQFGLAPATVKMKVQSQCISHVHFVQLKLTDGKDGAYQQTNVERRLPTNDVGG